MSNTLPKKKTSKGRQRIEIKQLEKQSTKEVTFSKRRTGLFKKAGELCILCGAEVGIIVFSPARKPYCFGHPNIETILKRYLSNNTSYDPAMTTLSVHDYNEAYEKSVEELKEEKKRAEKANEDLMNKPIDNEMQWLDEDVENIGIGDVHDYLTALQELRKKVVARYESMRISSNAMMFDNSMSQVGFRYHQFGNGGGDVNGVGAGGSAFFGGFGNGGGHGML